LLEKRKNKEMMCFGLLFSEDIAFKNWPNRKPEDMKFMSPVNFEELVNFSDSTINGC